MGLMHKVHGIEIFSQLILHFLRAVATINRLAYECEIFMSIRGAIGLPNRIR
jgi:hypothetical protein